MNATATEIKPLSINEVKELDATALQTKLTEISAEINRVSHLAADKIKERSQLKNLRKTRARILTVINNS